MEIRLVRASDNDLQTILDILNDGTRNKVRRGDLAWGMSDQNADSIRNMISEGLFYIAFTEDTPLGTLALAWQDIHMWGKQPPDAGYVQRFAVAAGFNGQNIGGQILDLAIKEVEQHGRQYLRIAVPSGNAKLRAYYENHGFVRADNKIVSPIHPTYAAAYYERSVDGIVQDKKEIAKKNLFYKLSRLSRSGR